MKKRKILLSALAALMVFQTCKTKENIAGNGENQEKEQQVVSNNTAPEKNNTETIVVRTNEAQNKQDTSKNTKKAAEANTPNDSIVPMLVITEDESDDDGSEPPKKYPIVSPMPSIVKELLPDVKWEFYIDDLGRTKYYKTNIGEQSFSSTSINGIVYSYYSAGEIPDKKLIELFISLFMHPYDPYMEVISTKKLEKLYNNNYNYKTIIIVNGEQIDFYSLVKRNRYIGCLAVKNGRLFKQIYVD